MSTVQYRIAQAKTSTKPASTTMASPETASSETASSHTASSETASPETASSQTVSSQTASAKPAPVKPASARPASAKIQEIVLGPDDADVVVTIAGVDCGLDPTVAYMRGKLKATGHTGVLLDALRSGEAAAALAPYA